MFGTSVFARSLRPGDAWFSLMMGCLSARFTASGDASTLESTPRDRFTANRLHTLDAYMVNPKQYQLFLSADYLSTYP